MGVATCRLNRTLLLITRKLQPKISSVVFSEYADDGQQDYSTPA